MSEPRRGLIHVYTGDGKGKTTAALGLALRAAGHGWRTYIGQFMKGSLSDEPCPYGELHAARLLGGLIAIEQFGQATFVHQATPQDAALAQRGIEAVREAMLGGQYQIVVLDEVNVALHFRLLKVEDVLQLMDEKPPEVELVLTGRRVPKEIVDRADYVTEMCEIKHPYQRGILARQGIEF